MRHLIRTAVVISALIGGVAPISSIAGEQPIYTAEDIAKAKPVGTIEVEAEQLRLLLGGARGKGVLTYQGKKYPFSLKAVTVGGVGVTKVSATGDVYFLKSPADFAGTYSAMTIGATVGKGKGASQYQNSKGVFISVKSKSEGLALSLGTGGVEVTMD
ncbi:MAG TPA: DUF1134 domain-containing protein [Burkholderiales bacterium]|nr:DUF1134 domain-containing protein [Burkholderiales bacterium]